MNKELELKEKIKNVVCDFLEGDLFDNSISLFNVLGYNTKTQNRFEKSTFEEFEKMFSDKISNLEKFKEKAFVKEWNGIDVLFQLSKDEMSSQENLFEDHIVNDMNIQSYLFFSIELKETDYSKNKLAKITRYINRIFPMPVFIVFKYGNKVTLSVVHRRVHKRESDKDVLGKVTLIKDINLEKPHRAHIEILYKLNLGVIKEKHHVSNFVELHNVWREVLDLKELNESFYNKIAELYTELIGGKSREEKNKNYVGLLELPFISNESQESKEFVVRLIGRILFCWFLKEKKDGTNISLIPEKLLSSKNLDSTADTYHALFEPLFFEVLNRHHKSRKKEYLDGNYNLIPYLNGGLFDPSHSDFFSYDEGEQSINHNTVKVPDKWLFEFIKLLESYIFTIDENTSYDVELSVDPEILGRIFENLLAEINPETGKNARNDSGSFYTPREIVDYMVDESLFNYLKQKTGIDDEKIRALITYDLEDDKLHPLNDIEKEKVIEMLTSLTILDPACGSGAFPIGALQKLVFMLNQVDPEAKIWFQRQVAQVSPEERQDMEREFKNENFDYLRKLVVIRKNIYGVDIQPIAIDITRLRCFLTLIVDQTVDDKLDDRGIKPLPNLDFKFVCANSLITAPKENEEQNTLQIDNFYNKFESLAASYFSPNDQNDKFKALTELHQLIDNKVDLKYNHVFKDQGLKIKGESFEKAYRAKKNKGHLKLLTEADLWKSYKNIFKNKPVGFFETKYFFPGVKDGFDIVIGNPPYVSTKGTGETDKAALKEIYGFADDLYSHFYFRGLSFSKKNMGIVSYITSKTFWTIQTKKNLRELLLSKKIIEVYDTASPFAAMVDTCICSVINKDLSDNYEMSFKDGKADLLNPICYQPQIDLYRNSVNNVFFNPTKFNLQVYSKYNDTVKDLMKKWWGKIETSKKITKNTGELKEYRDSLKAGDVALLGTLTEGGQGLATANNGKYVGVREESKLADKILESRPEKLLKVILEKKIDLPVSNNQESIDFLNQKSEQEVRILFDDLKEKYGRDIFGQGYLFRIVTDSEIADVNMMTEEEMKKGIEKSKPHFVPYDKGDKDGNRWWLDTPFVIDWSCEVVGFFKNNSGKKGAGMPVVRNPQFYFREGLCWTDVNSTYLKSRLKTVGVYDVLSMSLFTQTRLPDWYFVCLINSKFISEYVKEFVNTTSHFQINDARQIPVVIPSDKQLRNFKEIFDDAYKVKKRQFAKEMEDTEAKTKLNEIQEVLDRKVYELYDITPEEIKEEEGENV